AAARRWSRRPPTTTGGTRPWSLASPRWTGPARYTRSARGPGGRRWRCDSYLDPDRLRRRASGRLCPLSGPTPVEMIVDQAHCLHEGVDLGRPDERPAALLEVFRQRLRCLRHRRDRRRRAIVEGGVRPEIR